MTGFLLHVADQETSITKNTTTMAVREAVLDVIMVTDSLRHGAVVLEAARRGTGAPHRTSHICMTEMVPVPVTAETWAQEVVRPAAGYLQWEQIQVLPRRRRRQRPPSDLQPHILTYSDKKLSSLKKCLLNGQRINFSLHV